MKEGLLVPLLESLPTQELRDSVERWLSLDIPSNLKEKTLNFLKIGAFQELRQQFLTPLVFGTAGIRAPMGEGFSCLNNYTIAQLTWGIADFLETKKNNKIIVLSYDSRHNSLVFAHTVARVLLYRGFSVITFSIPTPSPILAYATCFYKACSGIMITASHNPKEDNGYKIFRENGGQFTPAETQEIMKNVQKNNNFPWSEIRDFPLHNLKTSDVHLLLSYFQDVKNQIPNFHSLAEYVSIIYSPLMGTGKYYAQEMINFLGGKLHIIEEENRYDGNFLPNSSPNPEFFETFHNSITAAKQQRTPLCIVTDPDADRIGLWENEKHFNGNELGIIMASFLLEHQIHKRDKTIMASVVSTQLLEPIALYWGCHYERTLTGFKYIGEAIAVNPDSFLFGFEESGGYLIGPYVQDKDAIGTFGLIFVMANYLYAQGKTFTSYLEEIYQCVGFSRTQNIEVVLSEEKILEFLNQVQSEHKNIFGQKILKDDDFQTQKTFKDGVFTPFTKEWISLPPTNIRIFYLESYLRLAIRPSGTEPKLKFYLELFIPHTENLSKEGRLPFLKKFDDLKSHLEAMNSF